MKLGMMLRFSSVGMNQLHTALWLQIKQDVESLTQRMMLDPAADPADWQLGQMPRLQAIINAEESLLASQIKYFQGNRDHGRERAADFFSWTLAELVQPRLELSEVASMPHSLKCC